jgi:pimeloyl-ACP methyl ester carboxylesterase
MKKIIVLLCSLFLLLHFSATAQKDSTGYFLSFDKVKIHYEVKGRGKPILLIHGFTGTANDWKNKPLYDSLLANGFKIVIVDLRGNGFSDKPATAAAYANDAEAKDLKGLLKFLGIKKYYSLGYSRGSIILASLLVLDKNCTRAVIGGMGADFTNPQWPRRIGFYNALMNDSITGYEGFRKYIAGKGLNPLILALQQKEQPATSTQLLAKLKLPVLIICGDEDEDNGKGADLQALIPHSKFITVPGNHNNTAASLPFAVQALAFLK